MTASGLLSAGVWSIRRIESSAACSASIQMRERKAGCSGLSCCFGFWPSMAVAFEGSDIATQNLLYLHLRIERSAGADRNKLRQRFDLRMARVDD